MKFSTYITISLLLLMPVIAMGQQYGFRQFSLSEGLPQTEIQALFQDSKGIIWAGTNGGGLVRFNGKSFKVYTTGDGLADNIIYSLCEDREGNIWIGSMNSIIKFDGSEFIVYREDSITGFRAYNQIYADMDNRIWAVSLEDDPITLRLVTVSDGKIESVSDQFSELRQKMNLIRFNDNGTIYIGTSGGLYELRDMVNLQRSILNDYDELQGRFILPRAQSNEGGLIFSSISVNNGTQYFHHYINGILKNIETPDDPWFNGVNLVFQDSQNRVWMGNLGNGVAMYDMKSGNVSFFNQDNGLLSDFIWVFMEDHEANIWMGTRGSGLIKYSPNSFISFSFENVIDGTLVREIFQDSRGHLWFGLQGAGLVEYDGEDLIPYSKTRYPNIHNIRGMAELSPGNYLLASINGLFTFRNKVLREVSNEYGLPPNMQLVDMYHDGDTIWLSSLNLGLARLVNGQAEVFSTRTGHLESDFFNGIMKDSKGNMWFCSNNGIGKFSNESFEWFTVEDGLNYPITLQMTEDRFGRLWIATYLEGINIYNGKEFKSISIDDGLNSNNIYSIICDPNGDIWAGTANGVNRIVLDSLGNIASIQSFGLYDGFSGMECNGTSVYVDKEERIWFGTVLGAMRYDPNQLKPNLAEPRVHITDINLFFRKTNWAGEEYADYHKGTDNWFGLPEGLVFPHDSNHFTFQFEATSYQIPEKVRYTWKLEGLDKEWSPVSDKTEAVYPNIPPGDYTFLVKGMNNDGVWSPEPTTFEFSIKAPFWSTWYFPLIIAFLILSAIFLAFRIRIRVMEANREELERTIEEKTREVRSQNKLLEHQKEEISAQADRLQASYTNLENLSEIGKIITSQLSVEKIIHTVYESINDVMDASVFGIGIVNRKTNTIDFPGVKEKGETLGFLSFSLDDKLRLSSYCANTRKEIFINDFENEYSKYLPAITPAGDKTGNSSSILYLPLIVNKETKGVITVQSFEKNAYSDYHLNILRNLAVYTNIALENASAYKEIEVQKQKIEESNRELLDLNKEKNHLIGIVAHDLRNPLTSSLSIAENLKSTGNADNDDEKAGLGFLVNSLKRMNDMISKILDIRMIEEKKINVKCEKTDLSEVVEIVYKNLQETASSKNIRLNLENKKVYGIVDRNYLTQVFENLLSNAIKFSPRDSNVWIKVEEENGEVSVNFMDEGPGIKDEEMDKLFGKYQRLSAKPTGGEDSMGLGLSIVKKYVDVMGGKVWCESRSGEGANFIVSFRKSGE